MSFDDAAWSGGAHGPQEPTDDWGSPPSPPQQTGAGGWHLPLTLLSLAWVGGASFLMAFLTKDVPERPWWMMGLIFLAPAALLVFGAYLVESVTSAMTPRYSRRAQFLVALAAAALCFLVGCFGNPVYVQGQAKSENYVILLDRSDSMGWNDPNNESAKAINGILDQMDDDTLVGLILFSDRVLVRVDVAALDAVQRSRISRELDIPRGGGTDFDAPLLSALGMLEGAALPINSASKVIMVTDGEDVIEQSTEIVRRFSQLKIPVSCVKITGAFDPSLDSVIQQTGGRGVTVDNAALLTGELGNIVVVASYDVLRDDSDAARAISGALFMAEGLALGFALTLMLSCKRQKRLQLLLSPLMGAAAFAVCKMTGDAIGPGWLKEAVAFSLFGVVLMRKNHPGVRPAAAKPSKPEALADPF